MFLPYSHFLFGILLFGKTLAIVEIAVVMVECPEWRQAGVYITKDCETIIRKTRADHDQDIEVSQGNWEFVWWKEGNWANVTLKGLDGYRQGFQLNKVPHVMNSKIGKYTDFGVACSDCDAKAYCEQMQSSKFDWLVENSDHKC